MIDLAAKIVAAWWESPVRRHPPMPARQLYRLSSGAFRTALNKINVKGAPTPRKLGAYLTSNCDQLIAGYYIRRELNRNSKDYRYWIEQASSEDLRQEAAEERERNEAIRQKRRELHEANNAKLPATVQRKAPESRTFLHVAPANGWFVREIDAERRTEHFRQHNFDATLDYLPGPRFVIRIQDASIAEVKPLCLQWMLQVREVSTDRAPPATTKPADDMRREVWIPSRNQFVPASEAAQFPPGYSYVPGLRAMQRALEGPPPKRRRGVFQWEIFGDSGRSSEREQLLSDYINSSRAVSGHTPHEDD